MIGKIRSGSLDHYLHNQETDNKSIQTQLFIKAQQMTYTAASTRQIGDRVMVYMNLGYQLFDNKDFEGALICFENVVQQVPDNTAARLHLKVCKLNIERMQFSEK